MKKTQHITILGAGIGGLAVGYYAKINKVPFSMYEAKDVMGGNCITFQWDDFMFDSGAHRFHDKDEEITKQIKNLMGNDLCKINIPSQIYSQGVFIDFPLSFFNLLVKLGPGIFIKTVFELIRLRLQDENCIANFEDFALRTYGCAIARRFLLNYSEKLWGTSCSQLSPCVSGKRMRGLNLKTFLRESIMSKQATVRHLDGAFYYPRFGIGAIADTLGQFCGGDNIRLDSKVTRIFHNHKFIEAVEINGKEKINIVDQLVSTLPVDSMLKIMNPSPPKAILELAEKLRYRDLILLTVFLNKKMISRFATVYFPDSQYPFTRISEPKNRSAHMGPGKKTSLVIEIPCFRSDDIWSFDDVKLKQLVFPYLKEIGWVTEKDIIGLAVRRLYCAYPVLSKDFTEDMDIINEYLANFSNLKLSGRSGKFLYVHIHDLLRFGKEIVETYIS